MTGNVPFGLRGSLAVGVPGYYHGSMQKRSRRPHGIGSRKISVSVSADDFKILTKRANRLYRGNVSALVQDMIAVLKRELAADELLEMLGGDRVTESEIQSVRDDVSAAPVKRHKGRRAA